MDLIENYLRNLKKTMAGINILSKQKRSCCSGDNNKISNKSPNSQTLASYSQTGNVRQ